jgi:phospholipase C
MGNQDDQAQSGGYPRRRFLTQAGAAGLAGAAVPLVGASAASAASHRPAAATTPIEHIVYCIQENHSFDHYFGKMAGLPAGYGIPAGYTQPNGSGGTVKPYHFLNDDVNDEDPNHDWSSIHSEYASGKMDGFYTTNGHEAMGYYEEADLPYYYTLAKDYTLCANYFCGMLTETYPNRMVAYAGTSGGNTSNSINNGSQNWECILDLLKAHDITFKNYNFHCPDNYSILALWKNWATGGASNQLNQTIADFTNDCKNNTLPEVSFITEQPPYDEHPPANIHTGQTMIEGIVKAVQASAAWATTAIFITYDEGGGFFDHIAPKQLDAYGPGIRVPCLVVSPYAKKGFVDTTFNEHSSILKFIEYVFGLPTLASVNTKFNTSTPTTNNATGGKPFPPRDGNSAIGDMTTCFSF